MKVSYIRQEKEFVECAVFDDDTFERFLHIDRNFYTGSIVVGKVKFVKKDVGIFVDVGLDNDGILSFRYGLKAGDTVLVRICTEPEEGRGCTLSEKIQLTGRYCVLLPAGADKFSHAVSDIRKRMLSRLPVLDGVNFLYRSLAEEGDMDNTVTERNVLYEKYQKLLAVAKNTVKPTFLYRPTAEEIAESMSECARYDFETIAKQVETLKKREVEKDGVQLVFDKTEAMHVVDVNFHTCDARGKDAFFLADKIAVEVFAEQIRLRNLAGIIALDYINLRDSEKREELFTYLQEKLAEDYVKCTAEHAEKAGVFLVIREGRYPSL